MTDGSKIYHGPFPPTKSTSAEEVRDMVILPDHYSRFQVEPIYFVTENELSFLQGNVVKYVVRYPYKNGLEDLRKARRCIDMLIAREEGDPDWWRWREPNHKE